MGQRNQSRRRAEVECDVPVNDADEFADLSLIVTLGQREVDVEEEGHGLGAVDLLARGRSQRRVVAALAVDAGLGVLELAQSDVEAACTRARTQADGMCVRARDGSSSMSRRGRGAYLNILPSVFLDSPLLSDLASPLLLESPLDSPFFSSPLPSEMDFLKSTNVLAQACTMTSQHNSKRPFCLLTLDCSFKRSKERSFLLLPLLPDLSTLSH